MLAKLDAYRRKRRAEGTPEPYGAGRSAGEAGGRSGLFVVQKHAARRLHWDFRLEMNGVLVSWAVPRGPSADPAEKRMAVHVEDHPVEYADFEGVIPPDNYGAGEVICWDRGQWLALEDPEAGLKKGKLLFELRGQKLRGVWTLVRTKGQKGSKQGASGPLTGDWLLIKHADAHAAKEGTYSYGQESILSGLTIEEMKQGSTRAARIRAELERLHAPRRALAAAELEPMLAETSDRPFSAPGWLYELKYDGFRLIAAREGAQAQLFYRRGADATASFPDVARAVAALPCERVVLDGEIVVLDEQGRPSFQRLQKRFQLSRAADIAQATVTLPGTLFVFDLLAFDGFDLTGLPLVERKRLLAMLINAPGVLRYTDHVEERGVDMYAAVRELGLEGMVAKKADSPYRPGRRSKDWLKCRVDRSGDFVVVGYTQPQGARSGFGALHLAVRDGDAFLYAGRVGTGFSDAELDHLRGELDAHRLPKAPCGGRLPGGRGHVWSAPRLVVEVRYKEWTEEAQLRQPAFLRLRHDKRPEDCLKPGGLAPPGAAPVADAAPRSVTLSNLDKVFWPGEGYTKGDLLEYYRAVSPWLLPYLRDRPVVLVRYPDGIEGKSFFQKDAPGFLPGWMRTARMWSEDTQREIDHFVCDDLESLLYLINMGSIPLHIWSSRVAELARPDWCILDLDPKAAAFGRVIDVALAIRKLAEEIELPTFVKTSGSSGIHVLIPLGGQCTYEQSRSMGQLLATVIAQRLPDLATVERVIAARGKRVYIDYLQNGHGRLLASPLCVRPLAGAPVSTPLRWSDVGKRLDPRRFTIATVPKRMARLGDPAAGVLTTVPDLRRALERLAERLRP